MKRILHTILLLLVAGVTFAQSYPRKCTEEDIPSSERKKYFEQVENSMQNYYMLLLDLTDQEMRDDFISQIFMDNGNKHIPEFYLSEKKTFRLSPAQYLIELDKVLNSFDRDDLEFQVDNFTHQPDMYMQSLRSCYTFSEYDLTLTNNGKVVFKRRCRITSFFPKATSHIIVKAMQVEPLHDIIAYVRPQVTNVKPKVAETSATIKSNTASVSVTTNNKKKTGVVNSFDYVGKYSNSGLAVCRKDGKYGFIDKQQKIIVPMVYDEVGCNFLWQENKSGNDSVQWHYSILMSVSKNNKWGFVNKSGTEIVPCIYDKVDDTSSIDDRLTWVCKDNKYGCVDTLGNLVIPIKYEYEINFYGDEPCKTKLNGKWGFIDKKGNNVIPFVYDETRGFGWNGNTAPVCKNNKYGFINRDGIEIIPLQYEFADEFSDGKAGVVKDGKLGFINKSGNVIIPFIYEPVYSGDGDGKMLKWCMSFRRSVALVRLNGKYGLINFQGEKITDFKYDDVGTVYGTAQYNVYLGKKVIYLDRKGYEYASEQERNEKSDSILANQGDRIAQYDYALKLYRAEKYNEAYRWFKKAYENGNTDAIVYIAESHYFGRGTHKSYTEALSFFRLAAGVGDRHAVYMLGWMAEHSLGQWPANFAEAIARYKQCGTYKDADKRVVELEKSYNNGYEFVDLGLSVKWATCNVGASKPEELGDEFAWGETKTKKSFRKDNSETYKLKRKYSIEGSLYRDAARANLSGKWRMPVERECRELLDKCKWELIVSNGIYCFKVTGPNGASILLPLKEYWKDYISAGYWSASPEKAKKTAYYLSLFNMSANIYSTERYRGQYIRAVIE